MATSPSETMLQQAGIGNDPLATASALLNQGQIDVALGILEDLVRRSPNRADAWFSLGQVKSRQGEYRDAAKAFRRAIQLSPEVIDGYVHLGNCYLRDNRPSQAAEIYREGLKRQPGNPLLHFNLAVVTGQTGDVDGAIELYHKAIELHPGYAQAYFGLGNSYRDKKLRVEAEAAYRKAIEIEPQHADSHANLGGLLAEYEDFAAAIPACQKALAIAPNHVHAARNLALCLYRLGQFDEAADMAVRSLQLTPDDNMQHIRLGDFVYGLIRSGNLAKARTIAQWWQRSFPGNAVAQHMAAATLGEKAPDRAGDAYVRETFDRFAGEFENILAKLRYDVPQRLCTMALAEMPGRKDLRILDAGCGTGLCAPFLKPVARQLVGVDLSGGMLEKARARGQYNALHEAELVSYLKDTRDEYDLVIAADVFCYFGGLDAAFAALAARLVRGGLFAFTVESVTGSVPQEGYFLGPTGRYEHDAGYVRNALEQAGYSVTQWTETVGREEMGEPVPCFMVLARRT